MKKSGARQPLKLKLDLHVHTQASKDAFTCRDQLLPNLFRTGLDGLAITDHDIISKDVVEGTLIVPGVEISSRDGHIIGLGIPDCIPKGLSGDETIRRIKEQGGISIVAHPYDLFRSAVNPERLTVLPDAIETINSASLFHSITWRRAQTYAEKHGLPETGGSDSHIPETIGNAFTTVDCDERTPASIIAAIGRGSSDPHGRPNRVRDRLRKLARRR